MDDKPNHSDRVRQLFEEMVSLNEDTRTKRLEQLEDAELRAEIERLLALGLESPTPADVPPPDFTVSGDKGLIGKVVSHYRIESHLGGGGMGVVYRARDTRLDRTVALKFLPPELTRDPESNARFIQEAKAASALDHANICTIHDIDETPDGRTFITMACYEGETLKKKIERGALTGEETIEYAIQIAGGLAAAHARGIVHRDVKPANILVTSRGQVKLLDFGLAKLSDVNLTRTGTTIGTVAYMSPEQACGDEVDYRTDLWSLGVVMYEMLTGVRPFRGEYDAALIYNILHSKPEDIRTICPKFPRFLDEIIEKCLEKNPEHRYQTAEDLRMDLEQISKVTPTETSPVIRTRRRSRHRSLQAAFVSLVMVAGLIGAFFVPEFRTRVFSSLSYIPEDSLTTLIVLPFAVSGDTTNQAMAHGLEVLLVNRLSLIVRAGGQLRVIPNSEVRARSVTAPSEARLRLGATHAVSALVFRDTDRLRVNIQLIDTDGPTVLASETFVADLAHIDDLLERIVFQIVALLDVEALPDRRSLLRAGSTTVARANELYLEGLGILRQYDSGSHLDMAIAALERAISYDDRFPLAHAALGKAFWHRFEATSDRYWMERALESCSVAVSLNALLPDVRTTLGLIYDRTGRDTRALQEYRRAILLDNDNTEAFRGLGRVYEDLQQYTAAEASYRTALEIQPRDWSTHNHLGVFYYEQGRFAEAESAFVEVIRLLPSSSIGFENLGLVKLVTGHPDLAMDAFEKGLSIDPYYTLNSQIADVHILEGHFEEAAEILENVLADQPDDHYPWGQLGTVHLYRQLGDVQRKREVFRRAIDLIQREISVYTERPSLLTHLAYYYAATGERDSALAVLNHVISTNPVRWNVCYRITEAYILLDMQDEAIYWLDRALRSGYPTEILQDQPAIQRLRPDTRLERLLARVRVSRVVSTSEHVVHVHI